MTSLFGDMDLISHPFDNGAEERLEYPKSVTLYGRDVVLSVSEEVLRCVHRDKPDLASRLLALEQDWCGVGTIGLLWFSL